MKKLLKKGYENNYVFYLSGALASFILFTFTFQSMSDFWHREFVEAFSLFLFLSFITVTVLELKSAFFEEKEEPAIYEEEGSEEVEEVREEESEIPNSEEKEISNPEVEESTVYEWDEEPEESPEAYTSEAVEVTEEIQEQEIVKSKIERKKAVPVVEENEDAPAEAAGFVPATNDDPFS